MRVTVNVNLVFINCHTEPILSGCISSLQSDANESFFNHLPVSVAASLGLLTSRFSLRTVQFPPSDSHIFVNVCKQ